MIRFDSLLFKGWTGVKRIERSFFFQSWEDREVFIPFSLPQRSGCFSSGRVGEHNYTSN